MTDKAVISIRDKDFVFINDASLVQMYATTDNPLAKRQLDDDVDNDMEDIDGMVADDLVDEEEGGDAEDDGLDDGNDGFDDEGVIEIDETDRKPENSALHKSDPINRRSQDDGKSADKSQVDKKAAEKKKKKLLEDEDDADEKEMISKLAVIQEKMLC